MQPSDPIAFHFRLKEIQKKALRKLGLETVQDLLFHFPARYEDTAASKKIGSAVVGEKIIVYGALRKLKASKAFRKKTPMSEGYLEDSTSSIKLVWFNQPYIAKMYAEGSFVKAEGKVAERNGAPYITNPTIEKVDSIPLDAGVSLFGKDDESSLFPVYPESRGISSLWFYYALQKIYAHKLHEQLPDPIPKDILKRYNLPTLTSALIWIHTPQKKKDAEAARKRFAFEEVFYIQLARQQDRAENNARASFEINPSKKTIDSFVKRCPFTPTSAQQGAVDEILHDIKAPSAMSRLLEGDVGSGKTFVAAVTSQAVVQTKPEGQGFGNLQVAYMAPTEILATQLFENFISYFEGLPIQIGLITGSGCRKFPSKVNKEQWTTISRPQLLKWVANGEIPILIGTHALIQKTVVFKHLAYVIIDEQHRFGTSQRSRLAKKSIVLPHLLSMTATPIPRTLALTIYGDLDLTLLDEMPAGRKPVETRLIQQEKRTAVYEEIKDRIKEGRQLYVICPRIDEPDETKANALHVKSVKEEATRLQKNTFTDFSVGMLHGKMTSKEKDSAMKKFADGTTNILVATSVVEVGVNVPNATMIIIEGAERFGLAQLHQLRGRVLRSTHQAYCYIFPDTKSAKSLSRLKSLVKAKNGFELAEEDLKYRGAGELYGRKQWGISDIGMEALKNIKMVEAARNEAKKIVTKNVRLDAYPALAEKAYSKREIHFE